MTPSTAELARALVASPRWPVLGVVAASPYESVASLRALDGPLAGARLVRDSSGGLVPDLDDPATAGVLLGMLSRLTTISVRTRPDPYAASVLYWLGDQPHATPLCPTLGVAVARALLSVWEQP